MNCIVPTCCVWLHVLSCHSFNVGTIAFPFSFRAWVNPRNECTQNQTTRTQIRIGATTMRRWHKWFFWRLWGTIVISCRRKEQFITTNLIYCHGNENTHVMRLLVGQHFKWLLIVCHLFLPCSSKARLYTYNTTALLMYEYLCETYLLIPL